MRLNESRWNVLEALILNPFSDRYAAAELTGYSLKPTIHYCIVDLREHGFVVDRYGDYTPTELGKIAWAVHIGQRCRAQALRHSDSLRNSLALELSRRTVAEGHP